MHVFSHLIKLWLKIKQIILLSMCLSSSDLYFHSIEVVSH